MAVERTDHHKALEAILLAADEPVSQRGIGRHDQRQAGRNRDNREQAVPMHRRAV